MSLETITVEVPERNYDIHIGPLAELRPLLARAVEGRTGRLVADTNTVNWAGALAEIPRIVIRAGEAYKTFATVAEICSEAARAGLNRRSWLIAFGGGVTGDLTGFAAAIYMRGIDFIQIPTTLLAMIDSSVGGKTGADLPEGKNLIGCFHQPQMVLIDPALLRTLPLAERIAALAEAVKIGVMLDAELFTYISEHRGALIAPEPDTAVLTGLIRRCCALKAGVVARDERESGDRALLNYGHSFGHALEVASGFRLRHGEAVSVGMVLAGELALRRGLWSPDEVQKQRELLAALRLPVRLELDFSFNEVMEIMAHDKKNRGGGFTLALPRAIGRGEVVRGVDPAECRAILEAAR